MDNKIKMHKNKEKELSEALVSTQQKMFAFDSIIKDQENEISNIINDFQSFQNQLKSINSKNSKYKSRCIFLEQEILKKDNIIIRLEGKISKKVYI